MHSAQPAATRLPNPVSTLCPSQRLQLSPASPAAPAYMPTCTCLCNTHPFPDLTTAGPTGQGWLPKDLNSGRLDLFFVWLGALMAANLALFLWVALRYEYKAVEHVRRVAAPPVSGAGLLSINSAHLKGASPSCPGHLCVFSWAPGLMELQLTFNASMTDVHGGLHWPNLAYLGMV